MIIGLSDQPGNIATPSTYCKTDQKILNCLAWKLAIKEKSTIFVEILLVRPNDAKSLAIEISEAPKPAFRMKWVNCRISLQDCQSSQIHIRWATTYSAKLRNERRSWA